MKTEAEVLALAEEVDGLATWEVQFKLVRRLKKFADDNPEQFEPAIRAFCVKTGRPVRGAEWEDFSEGVLDLWDKVWSAEGDDPVEAAAELAKKDPSYMPPCSDKPLYPALANIAYHLSQMTKGKPFWLTQTDLAKLLTTQLGENVRQESVSRALARLQKNGILKCTNPNYRRPMGGRKGLSKEYVFTGKAVQAKAEPPCSDERKENPAASDRGENLTAAEMVAKKVMKNEYEKQGKNLPANFREDRKFSTEAKHAGDLLKK
jgi:hypothetical protein